MKKTIGKTEYKPLYKLDLLPITWTINPINEFIWTAVIDWSLILGGSYGFTLNRNQLAITKDYSGPSTNALIDKNILTKQK